LAKLVVETLKLSLSITPTTAVFLIALLHANLQAIIFIINLDLVVFFSIPFAMQIEWIKSEAIILE
jgi:hypothetical protein